MSGRRDAVAQCASPTSPLDPTHMSPDRQLLPIMLSSCRRFAVLRFSYAYATPALNTYEMDDQTPSRREVVSLSAYIQYAVFELEKRLVLWMFVAAFRMTLYLA